MFSNKLLRPFQVMPLDMRHKERCIAKTVQICNLIGSGA